jgi:hypothetical protein
MDWVILLESMVVLHHHLIRNFVILQTEVQWQKIEEKMKTPGKSIYRYMDYAYDWIGWGIHGARTSYAHKYASQTDQW